jgi:hypothetical protein
LWIYAALAAAVVAYPWLLAGLYSSGRLKKLGHYKMSREVIERHRCIDCGVNVILVGDYCMLQPELWEDQLGLTWSDNP